MRLFQRSTHPALRGHNPLADALIYVILVLLTIASIVPIIHVLSVSLSNGNEAAQMGLMLWPKDFTLDSYRSSSKGRHCCAPTGSRSSSRLSALRSTCS